MIKLIANNFLFIFCVCCLFSCGKDKNIPDVSGVAVDFDIHRFEQDFFALDTTNLEESIAQLYQKHPQFSELFFKSVLPLNRMGVDSIFHKNVNGFLNFPSLKQLNDTTALVFSDMTEIEQELKQAFQFYQYYFPDRKAPDIYTFISEYTYQNFIFDADEGDGVGVGLDMFLGDDYPYRKYVPENPAFSDYLTRTFNKKHLPRKVMMTLIEDLVGQPKGDQLLDLMLHNGKKLYLLDFMLPYETDSIKLEYTQQQVDWLNKNEIELWAYLLSEDLLYSTDRNKIRKLVDPSPGGAGNMPVEAPGRTANWVGWQIIKSYMNRHPETTLQELIDFKDAAKFLTKSRYRPK